MTLGVIPNFTLAFFTARNSPTEAIKTKKLIDKSINEKYKLQIVQMYNVHNEMVFYQAHYYKLI